MKIKIIVIGKTHQQFLTDGEKEYLKRLQYFMKVDKIELSDIKNSRNKTADQIKQEEGEMIIKNLEPNGIMVLLDERGKQMGSVDFSKWLQNKMNQGGKHITFVIGGAYGFSEDVYNKAQGKISMSNMTFSHEMIRMLFLEQLYRAFTIIRNEPYHHE